MFSDNSAIDLIIPVYNEEKYIEKFSRELLTEIKNNRQIEKVIFVDDGSSDKTTQQIAKFSQKDYRIILIKLNKNLGKGSAMSKGFKLSKKNKSTAVIFMDGDRQHNPKYLKTFIKYLKITPIVFGYRHLSKDAPWIRKSGNQIAGFLMSKVFNIKRRDLLCGFMAFRGDVYKYLKWSSRGYGVEAEIATIVGKRKLDFKEVLVSTIYLDPKKGVNLIHAFKILLTVPLWYLKK